MVWIYTKRAFAYLKALRSKKAATLCPQILREAAIIGWSGMRGIVSLTAALALPLVLFDGIHLEGRNIVIFITFLVIMFSLLLTGLTLPLLIRSLNINRQPELPSLIQTRKQLHEVAQQTIKKLHEAHQINDEELEFFQGYQFFQLKVLNEMEQKHSQNLESVKTKIIQAQRNLLLELWEKFEIDDHLLSHLEQELDLEEIHLARAELH
jgi:CPA1 family monovalent cation:H+ antiporter